MSLTQTFKTDPKKEADGIKIEYPPNEDGSIPSFIIRRTARSNKEYGKALERNMRPFQAQVRTKSLKEEKAGELLMISFVEGALVSWANIPLSDVTGVKTDTGFAEHNLENAKKLFTNIPDMLDDLQNQASDISLFRSDDQEENAKN